MASYFVAYLLWMVGGWFGLHHFYLGRNVQGILWFTTGAVFGLGWLRDMVRIPDYVRQANGGKKHEEYMQNWMKLTKYPQVCASHVVAQMIIGTWYYYVVGGMASFIFQEQHMWVAYLLASMAMSLGVWGVGSCGRESCSLQHIVLAVIIVSSICSGLQLAALMPTLPAAIGAAIYTRRYRANPKERALSFTGAVVTLVLVGTFMAVAGFFAVKWSIDNDIFYKDENGFWSFNGQEAGERFQRGFEETFDGFGDLSSFNGGRMSVGEARKLLEVKSGATDEEITKAYRKMSIKWHPDKYKGDPKEAQEMQTKLNEAREVLMHKKKNTKSREDEAEPNARRSRRQQQQQQQEEEQQQQQGKKKASKKKASKKKTRSSEF